MPIGISMILMIRETTPADISAILAVEQAAFGRPEEANLVADLLADPSANPSLSLLAYQDQNPVGHILFTRADLLNVEPFVSCTLLAPLAVVPTAQRQGIGKALIQQGIRHLKERQVELVFVLGYPSYYSRHGFEPASRLGFSPPYPIPDQQADAWMVRALTTEIIGSLSGRVACAKTLDHPEYWRK